MTKTPLLLTALGTLALVGYAQPTEINQSVVAQFSTSYTSQGFPFIISQPGSYKLTSNLKVPAGLDGIDINADNVTLDLGGFRIIGTQTCTGSGITLVCTGLVGSANGIVSTSSANITVRNGSVLGFSTGVLLTGDGHLVEDVHARNNGVGIAVFNGVIRRDTANLNLVAGINAVSCTITDNAANNNRNDGIRAAESTVIQNVANGNGADGLVISNGGLFGSNAFIGNGTAPIFNGGSFSQNNNSCGLGPC